MVDFRISSEVKKNDAYGSILNDWDVVEKVDPLLKSRPVEQFAGSSKDSSKVVNKDDAYGSILNDWTVVKKADPLLKNHPIEQFVGSSGDLSKIVIIDDYIASVPKDPEVVTSDEIKINEEYKPELMDINSEDFIVIEVLSEEIEANIVVAPEKSNKYFSLPNYKDLAYGCASLAYASFAGCKNTAVKGYDAVVYCKDTAVAGYNFLTNVKNNIVKVYNAARSFQDLLLVGSGAYIAYNSIFSPVFAVGIAGAAVSAAFEKFQGDKEYPLTKLAVGTVASAIPVLGFVSGYPYASAVFYAGYANMLQNAIGGAVKSFTGFDVVNAASLIFPGTLTPPLDAGLKCVAAGATGKCGSNLINNIETTNFITTKFKEKTACLVDTAANTSLNEGIRLLQGNGNRVIGAFTNLINSAAALSKAYVR